ncbi:MAG: SPOR domain-containing protein [Gammaproteobacteria bacterium]|nr:MAG: SPOR domain-containing protein [Gammaproteobacteria bacterium]
MKWVILCLVLINAAFFGWQLSRDQEAIVASEPSPPATEAAMVNRLLLVSELDRGVLRQRRNTPSPPPKLPPEQRLPAEVAKTHSDAASVSRENALAVPRESDIECYTVGPLQNEDDISALSAWFRAQGSRATLRSDERREVVSTWVFLPPLESREAADDRMREMQAANIDDIYVIPRGDMANAVSLGLFSQKDTLERRVSQLEERGFTPSVLPRYRTVTASWFDVTTSAAQPMTVGVLDQIFPDLVIRQVACSEAQFAGDPAISYNPPDLRQEGSYSDNAPGAALRAPGRSGAQ